MRGDGGAGRDERDVSPSSGVSRRTGRARRLGAQPAKGHRLVIDTHDLSARPPSVELESKTKAGVAVRASSTRASSLSTSRRSKRSRRRGRSASGARTRDHVHAREDETRRRRAHGGRNERSNFDASQMIGRAQLRWRWTSDPQDVEATRGDVRRRLHAQDPRPLMHAPARFTREAARRASWRSSTRRRSRYTSSGWSSRTGRGRPRSWRSTRRGWT